MNRAKCAGGRCCCEGHQVYMYLSCVASLKQLPPMLEDEYADDEDVAGDDVYDPDVFVTFTDNQAYPDYLINFRVE